MNAHYGYDWVEVHVPTADTTHITYEKHWNSDLNLKYIFRSIFKNSNPITLSLRSSILVLMIRRQQVIYIHLPQVVFLTDAPHSTNFKVMITYRYISTSHPVPPRPIPSSFSYRSRPANKPVFSRCHNNWTLASIGITTVVEYIMGIQHVYDYPDGGRLEILTICLLKKHVLNRRIVQ